MINIRNAQVFYSDTVTIKAEFGELFFSMCDTNVLYKTKKEKF